MEKFKTPFREKREQKEMAVYADYQSLVADPNNSKMMIAHFLCDKYDIASVSTIYLYIKRAEKRIKEGAA